MRTSWKGFSNKEKVAKADELIIITLTQKIKECNKKAMILRSREFIQALAGFFKKYNNFCAFLFFVVFEGSQKKWTFEREVRYEDALCSMIEGSPSAMTLLLDVNFERGRCGRMRE
jgi:hypothetical protein